MKKLWMLSCLLIAAGGLVSCDWSTTSQDESWSDRYNWVNFSGTYRGTGGAPVVSAFSTSPGTAGNVARVTLGTGNGVKNSFSGSLGNRGVVAGTVLITAEVTGIGTVSVVDDGAGALSGTGASGNVVYSTGAYSLTFPAPVVAGTAVTARYEYTVTGSGGTGVQIITFSVTQEGNKLTFVDNTGAVYSGSLGSVRTTQGVSRDQPGSAGTPAVGDTVIGSFEVGGKSAAGYSVTITGTFQGTVGANLELTGRVIRGTWVEKGGKTGDVSGSAS